MSHIQHIFEKSHNSESSHNTLPYVIAELGVNHNGSRKQALALVDAAHTAGADAIKLQCFKAELLLSKAARLASYQAHAGETDPQAMLKRLELRAEDMAAIIDHAHQRGLDAIVTLFNLDLIETVAAQQWDAWKIASPDIIHKPLIDAMAQLERPLILSTGASNESEIRRAIGWVQVQGAIDRLALLQCVSSYPAPTAALEGIVSLDQLAHGVAGSVSIPIGLSDHSCDVHTGARAAQWGARLLEVHLTLDRSLPGPDHNASLTPDELALYIAGAKAARPDQAMIERSCAKPAGKTPLACEADVRRLSRQSVVTRRALPAGHHLARDDLTIKRPGTGLEPWQLDSIVGRPLLRHVQADMPLMSDDIEPVEHEDPAVLHAGQPGSRAGQPHPART